MVYTLAIVLRPVLINGSFEFGWSISRGLRLHLFNVFIVVFRVWLFSFLFAGAPESCGPAQSHHPLHPSVQLRVHSDWPGGEPGSSGSLVPDEWAVGPRVLPVGGVAGSSPGCTHAMPGLWGFGQATFQNPIFPVQLSLWLNLSRSLEGCSYFPKSVFMWDNFVPSFHFTGECVHMTQSWKTPSPLEFARDYSHQFIWASPFLLWLIHLFVQQIFSEHIRRHPSEHYKYLPIHPDHSYLPSVYRHDRLCTKQAGYSPAFAFAGEDGTTKMQINA